MRTAHVNLALRFILDDLMTQDDISEEDQEFTLCVTKHIARIRPQCTLMVIGLTEMPQ